MKALKFFTVAATLLISCTAFAEVPIDEDLYAENTPEQISEPISPSNIQVLLEKDASEALLEVKGPYYIFNPHDGSRVASGLLGKRFIIHELESGLKWGEKFPGIHQIYIKPRSAETSIFVNGIQYRGSIAIYGINGSINIINDIDIESYAKAILSPQFLAPLDTEVMSALAILVRTDAYYHALRGSDCFWHVTAQETGYQGSALVVNDSPVEKAVDSSKHLILVHPHQGKNIPFAATWTDNCAGKTASYLALYRKDAYTPNKGVEAPHAALVRQDSKWSYQISKKTLSQILDVPKIQSIEIFADKFSNKVYALRVKDGVQSHELDFFELQERLGKTHLQSSDFTVNEKEESIVFTGYGRGHGVGLCLYSATALAQNGENAIKILSKFFPETFMFNIGAQPSGDAN